MEVLAVIDLQREIECLQPSLSLMTRKVVLGSRNDWLDRTLRLAVMIGVLILTGRNCLPLQREVMAIEVHCTSPYKRTIQLELCGGTLSAKAPG